MSNKKKKCRDYIILIWLVLIIVLFLFAYTFCSVTKIIDRKNKDMILIQDGYCYNASTRIIYIESTSSNALGFSNVYTQYHDVNGKQCVYDVHTGEWISVDE